MKQILAPEGYRLFFARDAQSALKRLCEVSIDLVLLDIMMPVMDGYAVCSIMKDDPQLQLIPVIFVTAMSDLDDEKYGFDLGAVDYITKPVSPPILRARVKTHLSLVRAIEVERTRDLIIQLLGRAAEFKDKNTGQHLIRMSLYSQIIARRFGLPVEEYELILPAAKMHDIGKIGISDHVLTKPEELDEEEWKEILLHPQIGADIIGDDSSWLLT